MLKALAVMGTPNSVVGILQHFYQDLLKTTGLCNNKPVSVKAGKKKN